jgi:hypothetical protein
MAQYNPYSPPETYTPSLAESPVDDPAAVPDHIVEQLRGTRPWVIFLAVLGFLGAGVMVLLGVVMMVVAGAATGSAAKLPSWVGLVYVVFSAICLVPAIYMIRYASSIGRLIRDPRMELLGAALNAQRVYWKALGLMCIGMFVLYGVGFAGLMVAAIAGKLK